MNENMTKTLSRSRRWGKSGHWRNSSIQLRKKELRRSASVADNISVWRMSQELEGDRSSIRNSEIEERDLFLDLLCKVQDNRYENQRYVLKTGSDSRSDGDEDQRQSLEQGRDTSDIIPINGTLPNGGITTSPLPGILISPTTDGPDETQTIPNGSAKCNGVLGSGEGEGEGEGGSESGGCDVGRESLSPPPLPQSSLTPSRRSMQALQNVLLDKGPYPLVIEPPDGGYWIQNGVYESAQGEDGVWRAPEISTDHYRVDVDKIALIYDRHFMGKKHRNYVARDSKVGPLLFSIKFEEDYQGSSVRMILRTQKETIHRAIPAVHFPEGISDPEDYMKYLYLLIYEEQLNIERAIRIYYPKAPDLIKKYDEHTVAKTHKFGVIYQSFGQTSEEELFGNVEHPPALEEFLEMLGDSVRLRGFSGYRGGLDVLNDQTGEYSVYTEHKDREIMFHVSTLLPYDSTDSQHVQRKRHIGNDIVLIVFQDENTPFCPNTVRSHFVHSYIIVQVEHPNTDHTVYKVAVAAKENVPEFGPPIPVPALFQKGPEFREWLLTKILNAEFNSHRAPDFLRLANRTRGQLFLHLIEDLAQTMEDVDYPSLGKYLISAEGGSSPSPRNTRRRRKTLGSIFARKESLPITILPSFSKRKSFGGSPRYFRKMFESSIESPVAVLIGSTPDLSFISETSAPVRSQSIGNNTSLPLSPDDVQKNGSSNKAKVKRRFTFRKEKEKKKVKRAVSEIGGSFGPADFSKKKRKSFNSPRSLRSQRTLKHDSSEDSSIASGMNWSIPCDLPGAVEASGRRGRGRTSLDSLTLDGYVSHCQSNPSITERGENEELSASASDVRVSHRGPLTADVAVQVGSMFKFPSPGSSVSPTSPHMVGTGGSRDQAQQPLRKLLTPQESRRYAQHSPHPGSDQAGQTSTTRSHHHHHHHHHHWKGDSRKVVYAPSSPSLLVSSPSEESATLPRTSSRQDDQSYNFEEESDLRPDERVIYRAESTDSVSSEVDEMYDSLLQSLNALTVEVTRLRQNNFILATENAKFASQNRTMKARHHEMKQQLSQAQQQINTLQLKLKLYQPNFPEDDQ